jgi:nitrite reductase/ring-hydroxylating ferredoxin subunit
MDSTSSPLGGMKTKIDGLRFSSLEENKLTEVTVGTKRVGIVRRKEQVFAFAALCPHAGVPLCTGWIDGLGRIVCPEHKYRFDPANGRNTSGEGYKLFTYPIEVVGDEVYITLPQPS